MRSNDWSRLEHLVFAMLFLAFVLGGTAALMSWAEPPPVRQAVAQQVTHPEWIVIFDSPAEDASRPWMNLRVVVRADKEGQAIVHAVRYLQGVLDSRVNDKLKFVEAAPKPEEKR